MKKVKIMLIVFMLIVLLGLSSATVNKQMNYVCDPLNNCQDEPKYYEGDKEVGETEFIYDLYERINELELRVLELEKLKGIEYIPQQIYTCTSRKEIGELDCYSLSSGLGTRCYTTEHLQYGTYYVCSEGWKLI